MAPRVSVKPDFPEAKERLDAWWAGSSMGRPALICRIPTDDAPPEPVDDRPRAEREMDPAFHLAQAERALAARHFPAETMPGVFPRLGNELVIPAVLAGAELEYRPETTWIKPIDDIYERDLEPFSPEHPVFAMLAATLRLLHERCGDRGLLAAPPLLDGMTTLSMFRGPAELCLDAVERPEDVKRVARELDRVAVEAHRAMFTILEALGHAQTVTWCDIYAPGKCEMVQCDFAIMLSPAMFDQFALPYLHLLTEYMDRSCYHLDGTPQTRFLEQICSVPRLGAIQWNPEPPAPPPLAWLDFFRAVRRRKRSLWISCDADTAEGLTRALGPDGLLLSVPWLKSLDEAERLIERLTRASKHPG